MSSETLARGKRTQSPSSCSSARNSANNGARPFDQAPVPIYLTSAKTGQGVDELAGVLVETLRGGHPGIAGREPYFFFRWVKDEWGRVGTTHLDLALGGAQSWLERCGGFETAQQHFGERLLDSLQR